MSGPAVAPAAWSPWVPPGRRGWRWAWVRRSAWRENGLVFCTRFGTALLAGNVWRAFRSVLTRASITAADWTPRDLRHSFVSILSDSGVRIDDIADLCRHDGHREGLPSPAPARSALNGAVAMDRIFDAAKPGHESDEPDGEG